MTGLAVSGQPAGRVPWRSWALWVSLSLNVFLVALVGSQVVHQRPRHPGPGSMAERLTRGMPADDVQRFRAALAKDRPLFALAQERVDDARASLARSIARTPYDDGLVHQRQAEFQQRLQEQFDRIADSMLPTVATLSPEARQRLAAAIERPAPPPPREGHAP